MSERKSLAKLRVILVDDHETVRTGLRVILNAQPDIEVIGEAGDGQTALELLAIRPADVVVMDISMPRLNGVRTTQILASRIPPVRVLAVTRHQDAGYVQQLLRAGAAGYVLKQSRSEEVVRGIRTVAAGGIYIDPAMAERAIGMQRASLPTRDGKGAARELSVRETEVLKMIAWGYSNKEIAARLSLSVKTIESHEANAMQKLELRSRIQVVQFAVLQGWLEQDTT